MTRDELIGKLRNHWGQDMRELMHAAADMLEADAKPLTDEEIYKLYQDETGFLMHTGHSSDIALMDFAQAIEAKILERKK